MTTPEEKKAFALNAIGAYFKDPSICAANASGCAYALPDGRKCVAGQFLNERAINEYGHSSLFIKSILDEKVAQEHLFLPHAVGVLDSDEWTSLQRIHDALSSGQDIDVSVADLDLFTMEELQAWEPNQD
jgi:hypothetical protein